MILLILMNPELAATLHLVSIAACDHSTAKVAQITVPLFFLPVLWYFPAAG
jgi:hypothetical protein